MLSVQAFSQLLEILYAAPLQEQDWQRFLTLVCEYTGSKHCFFLCADNRLGLSIQTVGGTAPVNGEIQTYNSEYATTDPFRAPLIRSARTGVFRHEFLLADAALLQTDMYRDLLVPLGIRYATMVSLTLTVRRIECLSIWRSPEQGPMDDQSMELLNALFPHIQRALELRQVLGLTRQRLSGVEAVADASATPTFLLTVDGHILHRNASAGALLESDGTLMVQGGRLAAADIAMQQALRNLVARCGSPAAISSASGVEVLLPGESEDAAPAALSLPRANGRRPLNLLALPVPAAQRRRGDAEVLLLASDPEREVAVPDGVLGELYRLTSAETEVANGLLMSYSVEEISALRRVSVGTVRHQVKSILAKTGTSRQSDLVRLLMSLPRHSGA